MMDDFAHVCPCFLKWLALSKNIAGSKNSAKEAKHFCIFAKKVIQICKMPHCPEGLSKVIMRLFLQRL
jgi:hypothetical protein